MKRSMNKNRPNVSNFTMEQRKGRDLAFWEKKKSTEYSKSCMDPRHRVFNCVLYARPKSNPICTLYFCTYRSFFPEVSYFNLSRTWPRRVITNFLTWHPIWGRILTERNYLLKKYSVVWQSEQHRFWSENAILFPLLRVLGHLGYKSFWMKVQSTYYPKYRLYLHKMWNVKWVIVTIPS